MLDETVIEKRLATLEEAVFDLQRKVENKPSENWLDKLIGSISDEAAFLETLEYGRALRQSDQPTDEDDNPS
ncbi:MAG: transferase hexapeptide repeat containing protein [Moorea sp. SIO2B7]|nr:transferase hexapeptide repeat containing protein [Moorena sp. SIO2B7]